MIRKFAIFIMLLKQDNKIDSEVMEIEQLRKELNHLLDNVVEHSKDFSEGRQIPSLEISVVLAKINKMQENLSVLRHLLKTEEKKFKAEKRIQREMQQAVIVEEPKEQAPVIETPVEATPPSSEENTEADSVADKMQHTPISKLVDAFNLNDRYLYANDLFNKDMNAFNECIKSLDNCENSAQANEIISSLKLDEESDTIVAFLEIISRRFS